jgi:hypothetical protein
MQDWNQTFQEENMKSFIKCCALLCCAAMMLTTVGCSIFDSFSPQPTQPPVETTPSQMKWEVPDRVVLVIDDATYGSTDFACKVYADDADVTAELSYTVDDASVVALKDGVATALCDGNTYITVSYKEQSKKVPVYVLKAQESYTLSDSKSVRTFGRTYMENGALCIPNVASGFEVNFIGTSLQANISTIGPTFRYGKGLCGRCVYPVS